MQPPAQSPRVIVGLPVHNGARHLTTAIASILAQTHRNLRLIIADNASSDRTEIICREFARQDRRIHYVRQSSNIGAAANFNHVFHLATGSQYFKWAAHDDWLAPTFIEKCVAALERDPAAVLCQSRAKIVDERGRVLEIYDHAAYGTGADAASARFRARLSAQRCIDIFGVIRADALASTALIEPHLGADRTLLLELALRGRFLTVPDYLFFNVDHSERFTRRRYSPYEELSWYQPEARGHGVFRTWTLLHKGLKIISRDTRGVEKWKCYWHLLRATGQRRRLSNLALESLLALNPELYRRAYEIKRLVRGHRSRSTPVPTKSATRGNMHE